MKKFLVVLLAVCFAAALVSAKKSKKHKSKAAAAETESMGDMQEAGEWPQPSSIGDFGVPSGMASGMESMINSADADSDRSGKKKSSRHHG